MGLDSIAGLYPDLPPGTVPNRQHMGAFMKYGPVLERAKQLQERLAACRPAPGDAEFECLLHVNQSLFNCGKLGATVADYQALTDAVLTWLAKFGSAGDYERYDKIFSEGN